MNVVAVFESMFGNTPSVAEAIAEGLREADPDVTVAMVAVARASFTGSATSTS